MLLARAALLLSSTLVPPPQPLFGRHAARPIIACVDTAVDTGTFGAPTAEVRESLASAVPAPSLQPREVISSMMNALHKTSCDYSRPYFGLEVALRFLSPTHQVATISPRDFLRYLRQPHKVPLLEWNEYRWEGDPVTLGNEAYQQVSVRSAPDVPWVSVRWMLVKCWGVGEGASQHPQWLVDAVYVSEPDADADGSERLSTPDWDEECVVTPLPPGEAENLFAQLDVDGSGKIDRAELREAAQRLGIARTPKELDEVLESVDADGSGTIELNEFEDLLSRVNNACAAGRFAADLTAASRELASPAAVVEKVQRALRQPDEPYPLHGSELAIRYCSPTNRASQLSPQAFARYLAEPWYKILTEWDEIEFEEEEVDANKASQDVLIKREGDESWTIVNYQLSRHNGRWLMDSMTITE